jgi:putative ABC transport system permease protein
MNDDSRQPAPRSRLRLADLLALGVMAVRGRPLRTLLSVLGIAIGIASITAVPGISASSQAALLAQIDALGTNLLTVTPGVTAFGAEAELATTAPQMIARIDGVKHVAWSGTIPGNAYRSGQVPAAQTNNLSIISASLNLASTLQVPVVSGVWFNPATAQYPTAVLGAKAARRLGFTSVTGHPEILAAGQWLTVIGVLAPSALAPTLDTTVMIGPAAASNLFHHGSQPAAIYERSAPERVAAVRALLPATANPQHPEAVDVTRPSDALVARAAARASFTQLFLALGAVVLLVAAVGVANTMVISVLERRSEIGLYRALGATRAHIRRQFLTEALALTLAGGVAGTLAGAGGAIGYALARHWQPVIPATALAAGLVTSAAIGAVAGVYPAAKASRMAPTDALNTT